MGKKLKQNEYYSYDEIDKTKCNYRIIIGERSNGKTYGFKMHALLNYFKNGKQFAYLRRTAEEIKIKRVESYFNDCDEVLQSYGKQFYPQYDFLTIKCGQGRFDLYGCTLEPMSNVKLDTIGYYFALVQSDYDKSNSYPKVNMICYEEFLTRRLELPDEFSLFLNFISTIKRKRSDMIIYMLGNTVTRNSSILSGMGINPRELIQGQIKCYQYYGEHSINTVAVEYCRNYDQTDESESFFTFNTPREMMITRGAWEVDTYDLIDDMREYDFKTPRWSLILDFPPVRIFCYIIDKQMLVTADRQFKRAKYICIGAGKTNVKQQYYNINNTDTTIKLKKLILYFWNNRQILFDNNLTGDDFQKIIESKF